MNLLKKLAELFELEEAEVSKKLNLKPDATTKEIKEALGVYGLFLDKTELETYIKNKVQNKISEVEKLNEELDIKNKTLLDFEKVNTELKDKFSKISAQIKNNLEKEWVSLKLPKTNLEDIKYEDLDFLNLKSEALRIAKLKNITPEIVDPKQIENIKSPNNNLNGTQSFDIGARRIK
ncbi:hypothetical protein [Metamycoplasma hyosynoviae]|uniref:hypothetical protein n=1 Tax=Metamycoplasma hyosynoviae TaxID=29559 RepID=UPI000461F27A|nr:hypothetical protein [Metamycoplasma hyosynoviae]KDE45320.1 hypothetical protein NPL4_01635 [Metamycoplasma hyosynoviae]MDC8911538.1 hypothetical protein [Metamycoplasma hyosynoviae]MDC8919263.1 hypothetical protein [Metamycoplasma hyosynoviae]MDC8919667.1 hypothetical protein [Metamycoplasma hyosynoviae]MDC8921018.1 hypothetical protein [Metamycoplasma hyosynoviae]